MKFSEGVEGVPETRYLDDAHRPSSYDMGFMLGVAWWCSTVSIAADALRQNSKIKERLLCCLSPTMISIQT